VLTIARKVSERLTQIGMIFRTKMVRRCWRTLAIFTVALCLSFAFYVRARSSLQRAPGSRALAKPELSIALSGSREARGSGLHISSLVQHGHIVEIRGSTDPGAVVMINGQTASTIFDGHAFRHFLGPLPSGTTIISVTSQDEQGGVNTLQVAVTIE
jgi:hypothetical protein